MSILLYFPHYLDHVMIRCSTILILGTTLKFITWYYKTPLNPTGFASHRLEKRAQGDVPKISIVRAWRKIIFRLKTSRFKKLQIKKMNAKFVLTSVFSNIRLSKSGNKIGKKIPEYINFQFFSEVNESVSSVPIWVR